MKKSKNYISRTAAIENLKRLFSQNPNSDQLTLSELLSAAGRQNQSEQTNRNWLANKMTQMKYHDLIQSVYSYGARKELVAIKLTLNGKKALGRISPDAGSDSKTVSSSLNKELNTLDIATAIRTFRDNYPEFDVIFEVKLKKA